jgi:ubiquitin-protein ligase
MAEIKFGRKGLADRKRFLAALTSTFRDRAAIDPVLEDVWFEAETETPPPSTASGDSEAIWRSVFQILENGAVDDGMRNLVETVLRRYPANTVFMEIAQTYLPEPARDDATVGGTGSAGQADHSGCRLFVQADNEDDRRKIFQVLTDFQFNPAEDYSTSHVVRYTLGTADPGPVRRALDRSDLNWTVVPAGAPDYLLSQLFVQGPDGRNFRFTDVPAATTVQELAQDTLDHYPDNDASRMTVTDRVEDNGQGVRVPPDSTLHDVGARDGDQFRVGYQTNAGSVSPVYRDAALARAGNQIREFVEVHEGMGLSANSPHVATVYELEFQQRSFGPPRSEGDDPVEAWEHVVQIEFGEQFPLAPPTVFWLSPIFHPNIWPNYDSEKARRYPARQGLVCLGELAEGFQPAMDLGRLCQTLIDMAAYRNYSIVVATGRSVVNAEGQAQEEYRGNVFDAQAAEWALLHPDAIDAIGGIPNVLAPARSRRTFHNIVENIVEP